MEFYFIKLFLFLIPTKVKYFFFTKLIIFRIYQFYTFIHIILFFFTVPQIWVYYLFLKIHNFLNINMPLYCFLKKVYFLKYFHNKFLSYNAAKNCQKYFLKYHLLLKKMTLIQNSTIITIIFTTVQKYYVQKFGSKISELPNIGSIKFITRHSLAKVYFTYFLQIFLLLLLQAVL